MSFDELQKKTAIVIALFSITTLVFMLHHTLMKQFAIAEVAYAKEEALSGTSFALTEREVDTRQSPYDLCIPVPEGTHYEDFHIENHYFTKKLVVRIHTGRDDFYRKHVVFCNSSKVKKSFGQKEEKELTLSFSLNRVYDCDADLTDGMISLRFSPVAGSNSHLVLLDPSAKPGTDAQTSLLLAQKILNLSEPGKDSVRFFLTRMGEDAPTDREVAAFINETGADRYLCLAVEKELQNVDSQEQANAESQTAGAQKQEAQTAASQKQEAQTAASQKQDGQEGEGCTVQVRTLYSDGYYIRNYGNVAFANTMEEALYHEAGFEALGLSADPDPSSLLHHLKIHGAQVELGADCLEQETVQASLHKNKKQEEILNRAAEALYEGLMQSYEQAEN
ncbi:MAG: hypothetical protein HXK88_01550 [Lachnospiraceae bacterium]|nr:hypothetical protein [Lachnospiraceae bacterium]